jgi:cell division protein FtsZ
MGILTLAVVTRPFEFEGAARMKVAENGIKTLKESVDAILVIPNQKLFEIEDAAISYKDAYKKVDEILLNAVRGISDIINSAGYQNVDFADVKAVMAEKGQTLMGTGEARGENRAEDAARKALASPLLDNISIHGATGILYNITASSHLSLKEIGIVAEIIKANASPDARIKFGIVDNDSMGDLLRVTVIATGFKEDKVRNNIGPRTNKATPPNPTGNPANTPPNPTSNPVSSPRDEESNMGYYQGKSENTPQKVTNLSGYINESAIPSMLQDPENEDDLLDVPSFQRPKITERK